MLPTYEVRLDSPVNKQFRIVSVDAADEAEARAAVEAKERKLVDFSLMPPEKDVWEAGGPAKVGLPDGHAVVDLSRWDARHPEFARTLQGKSYDDHVAAAKRRLDWLGDDVEFDKHGKAIAPSLTKVEKARYLAHLQAEPYIVSEVRKVEQAEVDANDLVRQVRVLHENDPAKWAVALERLRDAGVPLNTVTAALYGTPTKNRNDGTANGAISWKTAGDTFKTSLHTSTYVPNVDTGAFFSDPTNEITGTGYTAGGVTLGSLASSYDSASDQARYDAADAQWTSSTLTARIAVVYKSTGTSTTSPLIGFVDFGADVSTTSGTFTITWDATGVWELDVT